MPGKTESRKVVYFPKKHLQKEFISISNNFFIMFPSNQRYFITSNNSKENNIFLTTSFEFTEYPKWTFDEFDVALDTAHKLTQSVGNVYLWRETKGKPIKWMKVTK